MVQHCFKTGAPFWNSKTVQHHFKMGQIPKKGTTYAHLNNVLVHMIDKQEAAIFKSKQDFNRNKEKISEYIKYAENWQVILIICSYAAMACIYFSS